MSKKVYVSLIADLLHAGHIKVLNEADKHGMSLGLLTTAITELSHCLFEVQAAVRGLTKSLSMVSEVVEQNR